MEKITMYKFAVADISAMAGASDEEARKSGIPEATSADAYTTLLTSTNTYREGFLRERKSENTPLVIEADKRRDDAAVGLKLFVRGLCYSPNSAKRQKAELFFSRVDEFSGISDLPLTQESEYVRSFISMLMKPENVQLAKDLNAEEYVKEVVDAQDVFDSIWSNREGDVSEFRSTQSATSMRKMLEKAVNRYFEYVTFNAEFSGKPEWRKLQQAIYSRYLTIRQKYQGTGNAGRNDDPAK